MSDFVTKDSIARTILGEQDLILFVFAGAAAEFALNRAVDWLFFTNQIPLDPIGRLLSTANFVANIVFLKLGEWRYQLLLQLQAVLVPDYVRRLLSLTYLPLTSDVCRLWGALQGSDLRTLLRGLILPTQYLDEINRLGGYRT